MPKNDLIQLPVVRCEIGEINADYQVHLRLHKLTYLENDQECLRIDITMDTLKISIYLFLNISKRNL